jgi:hypothetical protein
MNIVVFESKNIKNLIYFIKKIYKKLIEALKEKIK